MKSPQSRAEFLAKLDEAIAYANQFAKSVDRTFSSENTRKLLQTDLSDLTIDEKIALGEKQIRALEEIAFAVNPHHTIDFLETYLEKDHASAALAQCAIKKVKDGLG